MDKKLLIGAIIGLAVALVFGPVVSGMDSVENMVWGSSSHDSGMKGCDENSEHQGDCTHESDCKHDEGCEEEHCESHNSHYNNAE